MKWVCVAIISRQNDAGETAYLLVSSKRNFGKFTNYYYPPGGHVEDGEDEITALKREIKEELGLDINLTRKVAETPGDVANQVTSWWLSDVAGGELKIDREEISEAGYFTEKQMQQMKLWPATKDFFETYIFPKQ